MPFIGKNPTSGFSTIVKDDLTPDGSTTAFTLSKQVASANDIAVFVGNVRQEPTDAYSVSGTTLTMTAAPASGINFYVLHIAGTLESSVVPADNTISTGKIQNNAITMAKLATSGTLPALDGSALTGITISAGDVYVAATQSGDQTITRAADVQLTNFTINEIDSDSAWDGSSFTVPSGKGGIYLTFIQASAYFGNVGGDGEYADCRWRKNGVATGVNTRGFSMNSSHRGVAEFAVQNLNLLELSAGDVLTAYVNFADSDGGNAITNASNTHIWILRIA